MPAKFVRRSAIGQPFMNLPCRLTAFCCRIDYFRSAVGTVSTGKHFGVIARNRELVSLALADRDDHHVTRNDLVALRRANLDARGRAVAVAHDALRCGVESKSTAVALRELVLIVITRHVGLAAPADDGRGRRG